MHILHQNMTDVSDSKQFYFCLKKNAYLIKSSYNVRKEEHARKF
jgi:hypothetical protein